MQYFRKRQLAARYGVTTRTVDRMVDDGRLPRPDMYMGTLPMWSNESIEGNEHAAATRAVSSDRVRKLPRIEGAAAAK